VDLIRVCPMHRWRTEVWDQQNTVRSENSASSSSSCRRHCFSSVTNWMQPTNQT